LFYILLVFGIPMELVRQIKCVEMKPIAQSGQGTYVCHVS